MNKLIILDQQGNITTINKDNIQNTNIKSNKDTGTINITIEYSNKIIEVDTSNIISTDKIKWLYNSNSHNFDINKYINKFTQESYKDSNLTQGLTTLSFIIDLLKWGFNILMIKHNAPLIVDNGERYYKKEYDIIIYATHKKFHNNEVFMQFGINFKDLFLLIENYIEHEQIWGKNFECSIWNAKTELIKEWLRDDFEASVDITDEELDKIFIK